MLALRFSRRRPLRALALVLGAGWTASAAATWFWSGTDHVYYGTDTRASELLAGSLLAVLIAHEPFRLAGSPTPPVHEEESPPWVRERSPFQWWRGIALRSPTRWCAHRRTRRCRGPQRSDRFGRRCWHRTGRGARVTPTAAIPRAGSPTGCTCSTGRSSCSRTSAGPAWTTSRALCLLSR